MTQDASRSASETCRQPRAGRKSLQVLLASFFLLAVCAVIRYYWGAALANADPADQRSESTDGTTVATIRPSDSPERVASSTSRSAPPSAGKAARRESEGFRGTSVPAIVATVNTQRITRDELARECLRHCGKEVLESMVNKLLIVQECQRQGIAVTRAEVEAEVQRMSKRFNIPVNQWLKLLKQERNVTPEQYANDIIWPTLALRKLAGERLTISREELIKEYETQYGEMVRVRLISVSDPEKAKKLQAQAAAKPEEFGNLAKMYSEDSASASLKGVINPIRRHGSYPEIEEVAFRLRDEEVSPVIHAGGQYVILKRERDGLVEAQNVRFERVAPQLEEILRDRKMRGVAQDVFHQLQNKARVEIVWNQPAQRARMPGVAATADGTQITIRELAEECIARHGQEILEGAISRKLIEQACKRQNVVVTAAEIDREIARSAASGVKAKPDGSPDVNAWLELVTKKQGMSLEVYRNDVVWPSVALEKLAGDKIVISDEDLRKGFEANYGPRVRCLAIVMNNQRRAQQVFETAQKNNTSENFGDLAAQYSDRAGQSGPPRRGPAYQEVRRPARSGKRGLRPRAGRAIRTHPGGRQVHPPSLRRLHQAGRRGVRQCPR